MAAMTRLFDSTGINMFPVNNTLKADPVTEYKFSDQRERDMMWMKYRELRQVFDEIEKTGPAGKLSESKPCLKI